MKAVCDIGLHNALKYSIHENDAQNHVVLVPLDFVEKQILYTSKHISRKRDGIIVNIRMKSKEEKLYTYKPCHMKIKRKKPNSMKTS